MPQPFHIRPATPADMPGVGSMQHACWMKAYPGVLDDSFLAQLSPEGMAKYHGQHFDQATGKPARPDMPFFVAESSDRRIVGMVRGGPTRAKSAAGDPVPEFVTSRYPFELFAIHVDPNLQRAGIGRALFSAYASAARSLGHSSIVLWVLTDNKIGRGFYDRIGGKPVADSILTLGGKAYPQLAYAWADLAPFQH